MEHPIDLVWPLTWVNGFTVKFIGGGAQSTWRKRQICSTLLTNFYVASSTPQWTRCTWRKPQTCSTSDNLLPCIEYTIFQWPVVPGELHKRVAGHWQTCTLYRVHHLPMNPMHVEKTMNMYYAIDKLLRCIEYTTSQWSRCIWRKSDIYNWQTFTLYQVHSWPRNELDGKSKQIWNINKN